MGLVIGKMKKKWRIFWNWPNTTDQILSHIWCNQEEMYEEQKLSSQQMRCYFQCQSSSGRWFLIAQGAPYPCLRKCPSWLCSHLHKLHEIPDTSDNKLFFWPKYYQPGNYFGIMETGAKIVPWHCLWYEKH